ncbi:response regulator receiver protein : Signal transduction histidine kinase, nitrogen specific, NtrB OS=uncultured bacterium GN=ACD_75C02615G0008 PE=4 SV=1: Response_reg [Gemmata massiliana]|uniref:Response regulatory domain-containing protein n=1 Tax=Gemmata massiliana TaxID=1210884 RepID=A0A6P2DM32_9BACT|nr:response regulator [Gemmata massiliana]VTS03593.1 response regulator receiver protein : Signal transduction histidine kinase, nitrogen specific, NtrB OS=uncultured bacterium GN=ACD_75C02615G0008 PE=4 SV=1: Response_reg [Gemmata massiliana]
MCSSTPIAVLVVDDEALVRGVLGAMLTRLGYTPVLAGSGAEGVDILQARERGIAAAVLDVRMPVMDGPTTMDALRVLVPGLPCVFLSGEIGPYTSGELIARGASAVIGKPVAMGQLDRAVALALGDAGDRNRHS